MLKYLSGGGFSWQMPVVDARLLWGAVLSYLLCDRYLDYPLAGELGGFGRTALRPIGIVGADTGHAGTVGEEVLSSVSGWWAGTAAATKDNGKGHLDGGEAGQDAGQGRHHAQNYGLYHEAQWQLLDGDPTDCRPEDTDDPDLGCSRGGEHPSATEVPQTIIGYSDSALESLSVWTSVAGGDGKTSQVGNEIEMEDGWDFGWNRPGLRLAQQAGCLRDAPVDLRDGVGGFQAGSGGGYRDLRVGRLPGRELDTDAGADREIHYRANLLLLPGRAADPPSGTGARGVGNPIAFIIPSLYDSGNSRRGVPGRGRGGAGHSRTRARARSR